MVPRFGRDPHAEAAFLWNLIAELQDDQLQFSVSDTGVGLPITYLFSLRRPSPFPVIQYARIDCLGGIWPIREGNLAFSSRKGTALRATGENRQYQGSRRIWNSFSSPFPGPVLPEMRAFCLDLSFAQKRSCFYRLYGGGRGIRTPVTLSGKAVFKTACFNRSHIPPRVQDTCETYDTTLASHPPTS